MEAGREDGGAQGQRESEQKNGEYGNIRTKAFVENGFDFSTSMQHRSGVNLDLVVEELGRWDVDTLDDYQEHLSQLAFFAMFPAVMPVMPAVFLVANAIDVRADK